MVQLILVHVSQILGFLSTNINQSRDVRILRPYFFLTKIESFFNKPITTEKLDDNGSESKFKTKTTDNTAWQHCIPSNPVLEPPTEKTDQVRYREPWYSFFPRIYNFLRPYSFLLSDGETKSITMFHDSHCSHHFSRQQQEKSNSSPKSY